MLRLEHIKKEYKSDSFSVKALDDISLSFRQNEFVAILGPSGSGKTTLLNIIGGLDQYSDGDLIINGKTTKKFVDADWDSYRNHSVGFVFQSYNLIPHQSVLSNVELALTLSGVSRAKRREKAKKALERVGLADQISKKPNQLSGGQMQRVAIARALVNDPDILLADEPTGALDTVTSVQIMDLLKEVSDDRLVIMVTHNPELADQYANRIIRLQDGKITDDSNPFNTEHEEKRVEKTQKTTMSFFTALSLSLNNLLTKKARTFLTSFAGSIGIIGIALILSLSTGINAYINEVQEDSLTSYPLQLNAEEMDMSALITTMMSSAQESKNHTKDKVYTSSVMYDLVNSMNSSTINYNDLGTLKEYFEREDVNIEDYTRLIQYKYKVPLNIFAKVKDDKYQKSDIMEVFNSMTSSTASSSSMLSLSTSFSSFNIWDEILFDQNGNISPMITDQYELLAGTWPKDKSDVILVLDQNNEITDITLHSLGLLSTADILSNMLAARDGKEVKIDVKSYSYEDICNISFKIIPQTDLFNKTADGWENISKNDTAMEVKIKNGLDLKICGIIRPGEDAKISLSSSLYYTPALTDYLIEKTQNSEIAKAQLADEETDIISGLPFVAEEKTLTNEQKISELKALFASLNVNQKYDMYLKILSIPDEKAIDATVNQYMQAYPDRKALEDMIFNQYAASAGLDEESIRSFIDGYSDEELFDMVKKQIREMLIAQHKESAETKINELALTPSKDELEKIKAQYVSKLTDKNTKIMFLVSQYTAQTNIPAQSLMPYLMTLSDAEIDSRVDSVITQSAIEAYATMASPSKDKVAVAFDEYYKALTDEQILDLYDACSPEKASSSTYKDNLTLLGVTDKESPSQILLYSSTFADKDMVVEIIEGYNDLAEEGKKITYTDYVGLILSSVTTIINAITYVLIAFVSISLIVSTIMIGIITYISVLERTKEIGVLRSIGASKRDVSRVFNAETLIIGLISGALGVGLTMLLCIPINLIIRALSGIESLTAYLPLGGAIALVFVSLFFTCFAGLFPALMAAKKDPVIALRSE